jgi:phosphohistidine phosphatase
MQTTTFLRMLQEVDDSHTTVMVTGHNPTIYNFIEMLLPGFSLDVPTCSTIVVEFNIDKWADLEEYAGRMTHRWIPDLL